MTAAAQLSEALPITCQEAAHWWYEFGFIVAPMSPEQKHTRVKWDDWTAKLKKKGHEAIETAWRPDDELCAIVDDRLFVLDADSPEAVARLYEIEKQFDLNPNLVVATQKGEHHYYRRAPDTYAHSVAFNTKTEPEKIDVRTGRTDNEGRSVIVLPPSPGKEVMINEATNLEDLVEVGQDFIDAVFRHNGKEPPRKPDPALAVESKRTVGQTEAAEIVYNIPPDCGYSDWVKVIMGVHNKFGGDVAGLMLLDSWSALASNYAGSEEIEYKYRGLKSDGGTTWGSVCKLAADNGADLSAIAKSYDAQGNKLKTFAELLEEAASFDVDTLPEVLNKTVTHCLHLPRLERRRVFEVIKRGTGMPLGELNQAAAEIRAEGRDPEPDELAMAQNIVKKIGSDNILSAEAHVFAWDGAGLWCTLDDRTVKQIVQLQLPDMAVDEVTARLVAAVADLVRTEIHRPFHAFNIGNPETVNCLNGEIELQSGQWQRVAHRREHYRTARLPVAYDPDARAPLFAKFLSDIFEGDSDAADKVQAILEMVGYTLMAHCRHERFIILEGSGANGKSVLLAVLEALCGTDNTAGVQPSQFENKFQRAHLHNKLANIVTEIKQGEVIDDASLKAIVSGEPATVEHKFKDPFVMRPFSTCWFGTNHMPHTRDFSDALFRRALVVKFNKVFKPELGNCDPLLKDRLMTELPGVLNMALDAYARALGAAGFTMPTSCIVAREEWRQEADQVAQFVEEECRRVPGAEVQASQLYSRYRKWAEDAGFYKLVTMKSFRDRLTKMGFGSRRTMHGRFVTEIAMQT